jgi:hypothetical protein
VTFKIQGSHSTADEDSSLLGYDSMQTGIQSPELLCTTLKMETVRSSETLASINQYECHIPEDISTRLYSVKDKRCDSTDQMAVFCILTACKSYHLINMHYERLRKSVLMEDVNTDKQDSHMVKNMQNSP